MILLPDTLHCFEAVEWEHTNKVEKECKLIYWSDYFETSVSRKIDLSLIFYIVPGNSSLNNAMNKLQFTYDPLHFRASDCQLNLAMMCHKYGGCGMEDWKILNCYNYNKTLNVINSNVFY